VASDTRERMLQAAVDGLRRHGVAGMSFTDVLATSGAARGAIYHHFPGGKTQLVAEAATLNGDEVRARFAGLAAGSPREVVAEFLALVRPVVAESTAGGGCAVAAVAMGSEALPREASAAAFSSWVEALAVRLAAAGMDRSAALDGATALVALLEGAHVLCRAAASLEPFDRMSRAALALAADA
jgi:TetR/AcrR family transcriptional repressor of lmrAB and yxaGH operons